MSGHEDGARGTAALEILPGGREWWLALQVVFLVKRDDLLALDARRLVYEQVARYPGLHLSEIARGTVMDVNHVKHHLRYLEKHGLVSSQREGGYWRFYPRREGPLGQQEAVGADEKKVLALLRRPLPLHVTLLLLNHEELNHARLSGLTGAAHGTMHYHLKRLEKEGVVESRKEGRERLYSLREKERVLRLLLEHRPPDRLVAGFLEAWEALEL